MNSADDEDSALNPGAMAPREPAWAIERATLWRWIAEALDGVTASRLEPAALRALCTRVLDAHAPAALVQAQASGLALDHLVFVRLAVAYADRYGRPAGVYDVGGLRQVARTLQGR